MLFRMMRRLILKPLTPKSKTLNPVLYFHDLWILPTVTARWKKMLTKKEP